MNRIFLDCGAHDGSSIRLFRRRFPNASEFDIHSFEPNPALFKALKGLESGPRVRVYEAAVSTEDGMTSFFLGEPLSSTLRSDKTTGRVDLTKPIVVQTVSLSGWMLKNVRPGDEVILKLDIEGSEYDVLPDLIATGAMKLVSKLYGEWHVGKLRGVTREQHEALVRDLANMGFRMRDWCAERGHVEL